jgi:hypothetical protein
MKVEGPSSAVFCRPFLAGSFLGSSVYRADDITAPAPVTRRLSVRKLLKFDELFGAGYRIRTCDPVITNHVLYQLS